MCHGDLIADDIIMLPDKSNFYLIDPNPQNSDPLIDLSKYTMSWLLGYDYAIRDWLNCQLIKKNGEFSVSVSGLESIMKKLEISWHIGKGGCLEGKHLISNSYLTPSRKLPEAILLMAGLNAIALPAFHLIHHKAPARALYFQVIGQLLLELAIRIYENQSSYESISEWPLRQ